MTRLLRRVAYLLRGRRRDSELAEEMEFHRAMLQEELRPADESAAARAMGNLTVAREDARAVWVWPWLETVWQDVVYALRSLGRQPAFTLVAIATLGTAIGLSASLFTVYDVVALSPWPVKDPERVVQVGIVRARPGTKEWMNLSFSEDLYQSLSAEARSFSGLFLYTFAGVRLGNADLRACYVSDSYFRVLGARFQLGRGFEAPDDGGAAAGPVGVISHRAWQRHFGGDPRIVGGQVRVNGVPFTIVGVTSPDTPGHALDGADLWLLRSALPLRQAVEPRRTWEARLVGRLADGVSREQARAELEFLIERRRATQPPDPPSGFQGGPARVVLMDASFDPRGETRSSFILPLAGVLLVLLLACANVGNLLLARGAAPRRDGGVAATRRA